LLVVARDDVIGCDADALLAAADAQVARFLSVTLPSRQDIGSRCRKMTSVPTATGFADEHATRKSAALTFRDNCTCVLAVHARE